MRKRYANTPKRPPKVNGNAMRNLYAKHQNARRSQALGGRI